MKNKGGNMSLEDDFGWIPPAERVDPHAASILDLLLAFEKKFSDDGVIEFRLQTIMKRFGEAEKGYPSFAGKQKVSVDKINRNNIYPGYFLECGVNTREWTFWYQRYPRHEGDKEIKVRRPFIKEGDQIIFEGQEIDPAILKGVEVTKES